MLARIDKIIENNKWLVDRAPPSVKTSHIYSKFHADRDHVRVRKHFCVRFMILRYDCIEAKTE